MLHLSKNPTFMRFLVLLIAMLPGMLLAQLRFKPVFEGGASFSKDNFYTFNAGLAIEKKIDIDKSIETGLMYHNFEFYTPKTQDFYDAFVEGRDLDQAWDTTSHVKVSFHFTTIPIGANYYVTPKFYMGYRL